MRAYKRMLRENPLRWVGRNEEYGYDTWELHEPAAEAYARRVEGRKPFRLRDSPNGCWPNWLKVVLALIIASGVVAVVQSVTGRTGQEPRP